MSRRDYFSDFTDPPPAIEFWDEDTLDAEEDEDDIPYSYDDDEELEDIIEDALR